jgi:hypothetical protein
VTSKSGPGDSRNPCLQRSAVESSIGRTTTSFIYRRTKNHRAIQLLSGHTKLESTVRYLSIEVGDALEMAEQTEV